MAGRCRRLPAAALILSFLLRLILVAWLNRGLPPQSWEYGMLAEALLQGKGFALEHAYGGVHWSWMPAAYPLLLAVLGWLFGAHQHLPLLLLQVVLSVATVALVWRLGQHGPPGVGCGRSARCS